MNQLVEIQSLKGNRAVWFVMLMIAALPLMLYVLGWSQMKSFDPEEIGLIIGTILISIITIVVLLNMKTFVRLEKEGLSYKSSPFFGELNNVPLTNIKSWTIRDHKWKQGLGYKTTLGGNKSFVLLPGKILAIRLSDGREFSFGINRPGLVKTYIQRNWEENQMTNG